MFVIVQIVFFYSFVFFARNVFFIPQLPVTVKKNDRQEEIYTAGCLYGTGYKKIHLFKWVAALSSSLLNFSDREGDQSPPDLHNDASALCEPWVNMSLPAPRAACHSQ